MMCVCHLCSLCMTDLACILLLLHLVAVALVAAIPTIFESLSSILACILFLHDGISKEDYVLQVSLANKLVIITASVQAPLYYCTRHINVAGMG